MNNAITKVCRKHPEEIHASLTPTEFTVLKALYKKRWSTVHSLAARLGIDQFAVAQALYWLGKTGRIEKRVHNDASTWRKA